ncbi:cysteine-rich PDZ-binding protein isoform X2 [Gracilinanus agilis]|uniref:cysteine-rich PDZ-binding protein isoform X2 n=1 Tax=Gracilinanus agilis TaxID=191870 RepID=UPI001CFD7392|nr:cysteine-rich PDZ-binding protein isoform X2 [Gracilinanus agilis]
MVCEKCEKKLGTVITPDTWKDGARNTTESGGRKLNENKALTSKKARHLLNVWEKGFGYQELQANICLVALNNFLASTFIFLYDFYFLL